MHRYLAVLLLTACASTNDLLEQGHRYEFTSAREPRSVAHCIARNAEKHPFLKGTVPSLREGEKPGSYEISIAIPMLASVDAVAIIEPRNLGSATTIYALGDQGFQHARAREYFEGCER